MRPLQEIERLSNRFQFGKLVERDAQGVDTVLSTVITYVDADEHAYFGQSNKSKFDMSYQEMEAVLQPIEDDQVYPELRPDLLEASENTDDASCPRYVKRPNIWRVYDYKEQDIVEVIPEMLLQEVCTLQAIVNQPQHPNIVRFYGCRVRRGRITGIMLHAYDMNLRHCVEYKRPVDEKKIMDGLESAVHHLHSVGWAHNDVTPGNVMVSDAGEPILVDFGSCRKIRDKMGPSGHTAGWEEEGDDYTLSKASHDWHGLDKIRSWLKKPTFPNLSEELLRRIAERQHKLASGGLEKELEAESSTGAGIAG